LYLKYSWLFKGVASATSFLCSKKIKSKSAENAAHNFCQKCDTNKEQNENTEKLHK